MTSRRALLLGAGVALVAPAIVRADSLMRIFSPKGDLHSGFNEPMGLHDGLPPRTYAWARISHDDFSDDTHVLVRVYGGTPEVAAREALREWRAGTRVRRGANGLLPVITVAA